MSHLSENIRALMEQRDLNATTLAQATGVPQPTIHRILKGVSKDPRTDTVEPLANFFGVTVESLRNSRLGGAGDETQDVALARSDRVLSPVAGRTLALSRAINQARIRGATFSKSLEELFGENFRLPLADPVDKSSPYRFDYVSKKVVAEFKALLVRPIGPARDDSNAAHIPAMRVLDVNPAIRLLWRLSCSHLATNTVEPVRQYFLFLDMVDISGDSNLNAPGVVGPLARLISEGRLHGITVVACGPSEAAQRILSAEKGEDFDPLDDPFAEWGPVDG